MNIKIRLHYLFFLTFFVFLSCNEEGTSPEEPGKVETVPEGSRKAVEIVPLDPSIMTFALQGILPYSEGQLDEADSVRVLNAMMYCGAVDQSEDLQIVKVPINTESGVDNASVTYNGDELIRVIAYRNSDGINFRQRIYFKDGEIVYFRMRYLDKRPGQEKLDEFYAFAESGEIFKVLSRSSEMNTGEKTSSERIRSLKLMSADDKFEEYKQKVRKAWEEIRDAIEAGKN